ncbi:DUF3108 domain-containing protein [Rapidithrix thailandica]|uniref:DUF3108 domain-containing protein n=1 Tax=Rapidithrix thailandica TaxID=413964 RepID=A0AAW9S6M2_9BACT
MKKLIYTSLLVLFFCSFKGENQAVFRKLNTHIATGERLSYRAHVGFINACRAEINLDKNIFEVNERPCYRVKVDAQSVGTFKMFYKFENEYQSYIDTSAITTHKFYRSTHEPDYELEETIEFDHRSGKGKLTQNKNGNPKQKTFDFPGYPQDLISGYYYLRAVNFKNKSKGDVINMCGIYEDSVYNFQLKFLGKDIVKTKFGKIHAYMLSPIMPDNKLFKGGDAITIWVSEDKNRIPLKVKAKMFVGSVELDLEDYSGLKQDFNFAKRK